MARPPDRLFRLVLESHDGRAPGADSEEKHEPASDIDTGVVDSLKALDPERRIREASSRSWPCLVIVLVLGLALRLAANAQPRKTAFTGVLPLRAGLLRRGAPAFLEGSVVLAETRSDRRCLVERSGLVSDIVRLRSSSPLPTASRQGRS